MSNWTKGTRLILRNNAGMHAPQGAKAIVTNDGDGGHLVQIDWTYPYYLSGEKQNKGIYRKDRFVEDPEQQDEQAYYKAITEDVETS